jgi:hypothetical protein
VKDRVKLLINTYKDQCYWTATHLNPSDCGTRADPGASVVSPGSEFVLWPTWIKHVLDKAIQDGTVVHMDTYTRTAKDMRRYNEEIRGPRPVQGPIPYELPVLREETSEYEHVEPTTIAARSDQNNLELPKGSLEWEKRNQREEYLSEFPDLLNTVNGKEIIERLSKNVELSITGV